MTLWRYGIFDRSASRWQPLTSGAEFGGSKSIRIVRTGTNCSKAEGGVGFKQLGRRIWEGQWKKSFILEFKISFWQRSMLVSSEWRSLACTEDSTFSGAPASLNSLFASSFLTRMFDHCSSSPESRELSIITSYNKQASIAYGIDWIAGASLIGSASFYDHSLHLWDPVVI